ncbi:SMI1/KNR4 family protein [Stieleria varia]|uniref:SMI1 / KNR4 family protein n=1 Tax=Stieleria varia TaxID=2528005 RepID=A0A5C6ANL5_9BACT|nr:SMI1/KNR4 family protein [Stieleria varia]TWU01097.1 SMI1 / KNR4 family protein [Stieleria varia]
MTQHLFDRFLLRLDRDEIARRTSLVGCTDVEIVALESKYGVALPSTYRSYLTEMGHNSGRLLTHDHYAATYPHVLDMTAQCREDRNEFPECGLPVLPPDALVIAGRLGEQFLMIRCSAPDDSPVWCFNEHDDEVKESFRSVLDWLESLADEAKCAILGGYYDQFPNGTRP